MRAGLRLYLRECFTFDGAHDPPVNFRDHGQLSTLGFSSNETRNEPQ
jgi:hypothetical protein